MHTPDDDAEGASEKGAGQATRTLTRRTPSGIGDGLGGQVGREVTEQRRQAGPRAGTSTFDGAFGDAEHAGSIGDGVTLHVDRDHCGPLLDG